MLDSPTTKQDRYIVEVIKLLEQLNKNLEALVPKPIEEPKPVRKKSTKKVGD